MEEQTPPEAATRPSSASSTEPSSRADRRLDPITLIGGLVFVAVALVGLTDRLQLSATDLRWLGPVLLLGFGILLVVSATGSRTHRDASSTSAD